jgi:hypothetical protein
LRRFSKPSAPPWLLIVNVKESAGLRALHGPRRAERRRARRQATAHARRGGKDLPPPRLRGRGSLLRPVFWPTQNSGFLQQLPLLVVSSMIALERHHRGGRAAGLLLLLLEHA